VPNALPDQQIFQDLVGNAIDHGHPIGRPEIDKAQFAVLGDIDADRLDRLRSQTRDFECDGLLELSGRRVDDRKRPADFGGDP
jgi:hypothetical protein